MGITYVGGVKNYKAEGKGTLHFYSGSIYDGNFRKDRLHGDGIFLNSEGKTFKLQYHESILADAQAIDGMMNNSFF